MSVKQKLQNLINYANQTTGESDTDLTNAVSSLIDGYGGITPSGNLNITDMQVKDVTNYATAQVVDTDLVPANIKKDVNILGILGTFEGGGGGGLTFAVATDVDEMDRFYIGFVGLVAEPKVFILVKGDGDTTFANETVEVMFANLVTEECFYVTSTSSSGGRRYSTKTPSRMQRQTYFPDGYMEVNINRSEAEKTYGNLAGNYQLIYGY